jgi:RsiW-degrading membrane proteinase PrsW (M82 family)
LAESEGDWELYSLFCNSVPSLTILTYSWYMREGLWGRTKKQAVMMAFKGISTALFCLKDTFLVVKRGL